MINTTLKPKKIIFKAMIGEEKHLAAKISLCTALSEKCNNL